jgi:DNA-binding NtrC family response regulator
VASLFQGIPFPKAYQTSRGWKGCIALFAKGLALLEPGVEWGRLQFLPEIGIKAAMQPRLLVLDDEESIRQLLSRFFRHKGFEVLAIGTAKEAIEVVDREQFDLAIFDINLAGENGLELLRFFKTNFPQLPVIMLTGLPDGDELLDQAMFRGANGFMVKTDPLNNLFEVVRSYVRKP